MPREYTNQLIDYVDEGIIDKDDLIRNLLNWMSESEVQDFAERNYEDLFEDEGDDWEDEEEDEDYE